MSKVGEHDLLDGQGVHQFVALDAQVLVDHEAAERGAVVDRVEPTFSHLTVGDEREDLVLGRPSGSDSGMSASRSTSSVRPVRTRWWGSRVARVPRTGSGGSWMPVMDSPVRLPHA